MVKRLKEKEIVKYRAISLYWNYKENILEYDLIITLDEYLHIPPKLHVDSDCICMMVSDGTAYLSVYNCIYF